MCVRHYSCYFQGCTPSETLEKVVSLLQYMVTNPFEIFEVSSWKELFVLNG